LELVGSSSTITIKPVSQGFAAPHGEAALRDSIDGMKSRLERIDSIDDRLSHVEQQLSMIKAGENPVFRIIKELVTVLEICPVTTDVDWLARRGMALVKARDYLRHLV
jgi:hypothetical protein